MGPKSGLSPFDSFTILFPINSAIFDALSLERVMSKSSGVSSMNVVVHFPLLKTSLCTTLIRKGILVLTPLIRVSLSALTHLRTVPSNVRSYAMILTRRLS